jgi:hypothetical protein
MSTVSMHGRRWRFLPRTRSGRLLLLCGVLGFAALLGLESLAEAGGHSLDPTDPMNYDSYALVNDSAATVYVHLCADSGCARLDQHTDWTPVQPGAGDTEQVYWGAGAYAVYAVASAPNVGAARRCLLLDASQQAANRVTAPLSSAAACRG